MSACKTAVITGGHSYEVIPFHTLFRALPGIDAYVQHMDDFTSSPQEVRDGYDVVVFYIMPGGAPPSFSGNPKRAFEHLGETTQGIVILHHAIFAYPAWPVWDEIVGMQNRVVGKYSHDERIPVDVAMPGHPILQGIAPWIITDETYALHDPGPDSQVLLTTAHPECMHSLAWTRAYRNARVFCYQSGHDHQAYEDPSFQAVLRNGILWAAGKERF
jgi:type 1 glutamine amidotransferase